MMRLWMIVMRLWMIVMRLCSKDDSDEIVF